MARDERRSGAAFLSLGSPEPATPRRALTGSGGSSGGPRLELRAHPRQTVESCRPIAVRGLEPDGTPLGLWYLADIIDISQGGLCLLAPEGRQRCIGEWLQLDLRSHPRFGRIRTEVQLRWSATAHFALTFGVHFRDQLAALPELSVERRAERRDPNLEPWALERT